MSDPRLCSVHLEALPRRDDFRRAREALLNACGQQTLAINQSQLAALRSGRVPSENPGGATATQYWLVDRDSVYPLKVGLNTIGRMPDNDVVLEDAYVSRRHCAVLVHAGDVCELHDVASKNGTFLNGRKIDGPTRLKTGDEIRMCNKHLLFVARVPDPDHAGGVPTKSE